MKRIYYFLLIFSISATFYGCHDAKYHFDKFISKGGKINCDTVTINRVDTLIVNGDTVLVNRPITVVEKKVEYKTRWETKYKWKEKHDSIEVLKYITKWKTKEVIKKEKIEANSWWLLWYILGFLTIPVIYIGFLIYSKRKK